MVLPARELTVTAYTKVDRLIEAILEKIDSGEWPPGHKLPSDRELREEYDISQQTVRTAMDRLRGRVVSVQGGGRFVAKD